MQPIRRFLKGPNGTAVSPPAADYQGPPTTATTWRDEGTGLPASLQLECDVLQFAALHDRHGVHFSLVIVRLANASKDPAPLSDAAIRSVAAKISNCLRLEDRVYRVTQDELAVLLPMADANSAKQIRERLRYMLSTDAIVSEEVARYLLVWCGVAEWADEMAGCDDLVRTSHIDLEQYYSEIDRQTARFRPGLS